MGLSSVFQIFQLALGPSLPYTMGAFKTGQYFREVLIGVPFNINNRILVEFLGGFAQEGKRNDCNVALVAGLGGYIPGETRMEIRKFFSIIRKEGGFQLLAKTWPFNEETDIIYNSKKADIPHRNTIRFHVLNEDGNVLTQAEYTVSSKGMVAGPGSRDSDPGGNIDQIDSFGEILKICEEENLGLLDYIYSSEELIHSLTKAQTLERMLQTWKVMESSIENGLNNPGNLNPNVRKTAQICQTTYLRNLAEIEFLGKESVEAGIFATAVCEESLDNQLVITAPVCETAGVVAAVLKTIQKKYRLSPEKMAEALIIGGFVGSILQKLGIRYFEKTNNRLDFPIATAMAASAGMFLLSEDPNQINKSIHVALRFSDRHADYSPANLSVTNLKHANLALSSINLSLVDFNIDSIPFDRYFYLQSIKE